MLSSSPDSFVALFVFVSSTSSVITRHTFRCHLHPNSSIKLSRSRTVVAWRGRVGVEVIRRRALLSGPSMDALAARLCLYVNLVSCSQEIIPRLRVSTVSTRLSIFHLMHTSLVILARFLSLHPVRVSSVIFLYALPAAVLYFSRPRECGPTPPARPVNPGKWRTSSDTVRSSCTHQVSVLPCRFNLLSRRSFHVFVTGAFGILRRGWVALTACTAILARFALRPLQWTLLFIMHLPHHRQATTVHWTPVTFILLRERSVLIWMRHCFI